MQIREFNEHVRLGRKRENYTITLFPVKGSKKGYVIRFNSMEEYEDFVLNKCDRPMATAFFATNELIKRDNGQVGIKISFQQPDSHPLTSTSWVRFLFDRETDEEYICDIYNQLVDQAVKAEEDVKLALANTKSMSLGK